MGNLLLNGVVGPTAVDAAVADWNGPAYSASSGPEKGQQYRPPGRGQVPVNLLERAIGHLPEIYHDALLLSDAAALSHAQIGAALGLSVAAVKGRLHRARLLLDDALAPYCREGTQE
jgi:DNA-directed RNA polymerase specialized sigma24 family protein